MNKQKENVVVIFAKKPEIGKVKTRIAQETSNQFAYDLAMACLVDLLNKINKSTYYDLIVCVDSLEELLWFQKNLSLEGMALAVYDNRDKQEVQSKKFSDIFRKLLNKDGFDYKKALLIPMDVPFLSEEDLITAFAWLDKKKYVYGPEVNGGVYLIGIRTPFDKNIFLNIRWSTYYSCSDLTKNCDPRETFSLRLKNDLNMPDDIIRFKDDIQHNCPILYSFLEKNGYYLPVENRYVDFDNLSISIPVVSNIIEKKVGNEIKILIQTRYKPSIDRKNSCKLEIPSGLIKKYELAQNTAIRETLEETGLVVRIKNELKVLEPIKCEKGDHISIYHPFCCCQQLSGGRSYLTVVFISEYVKGELKENYSENKKPKWISSKKLKRMIMDTPDVFFGLSLAALKEYFRQKEAN